MEGGQALGLYIYIYIYIYIILHHLYSETATRLRTLSGSLYVLDGALDTAAAAAAGVTPDVARRFRHGFPPDFAAVIRRFVCVCVCVRARVHE